VPLVEKLWRTNGQPADAFISVAESHWEMVVTQQRGTASLTMLGPETKASTAPIPNDAEFFGIQFRRGVFMPSLPVGQLVDGSITLPEATGTSCFWLDGSAWELPTFDNADAFVGRLVHAGLLACDPVVEAALAGHETGRSLRSVQRRTLRATGLTLATIRQIDRARQAAKLLGRGVPIADAVGLAGYADHAHLARSIRRFIGQTPRQIAGGGPAD
jgi:AraC-like DNA-binding protein